MNKREKPTETVNGDLIHGSINENYMNINPDTL